jgi:hypothetical protein
MAFGDTMWVGADAAGYTAQEDRMFAMGWFCEGVAPAVGFDPTTALAVTAAAGFSTNVGVGWAYVQGDDVVNQGLYASYNAATENVPNTFGAPASNGRVDLLVARIEDSEHVPGAATPNQMRFAWVRGTAQSGADQNNSSTWPTVPSTALILASVLINTGDTSIVGARLADQRKLAGPGIFGEDGKRYRLGVNINGLLGIEEVG